MERVPDHPIIRHLRDWGEPEKPRPQPICPICGQEAEEFVLDWENDVIGCDCCTDIVDAQRWAENH